MQRIPGVKNFIESNSRKYDATKDTEPMCPICMVNFADEPDKLIAELSCSSKHIFHAECLTQWVEKNDICPLCREKIPEKKVEKKS